MINWGAGSGSQSRSSRRHRGSRIIVHCPPCFRDVPPLGAEPTHLQARLKGIYQHCAQKHLRCYLSEFDVRYSNRVWFGLHDTERTQRAVRGA